MRQKKGDPKDNRELFAQAKAGLAMRRFIESTAWTEGMAPMLKKQEEELGPGGLWKPGNLPTMEAVGLGCAFNGGRLEQLKVFRQLMNIVLERGEKAVEKLKARGLA